VRSLFAVAIAALFAFPALAQHDISKVDPAPPDAAIATPMPVEQQRRLKKYDLPELAGARQALGSQLIDGRLPKPLIDFITREGSIEQRLSIFEGGLTVIDMKGAATIRKKVLLPGDALAAYISAVSPETLRKVDQRSLAPPEANRKSLLRVYDEDGAHVELVFHPGRVLPKTLSDHLLPLRDLLRAISEDRSVTSSVAGYEPKPGDELVGDDQKVYRVVRVVEGAGGVVELRCLDAPTTIYVMKTDLHLHFVGARPQ
jgi:hypothetical protein